MESFGVIFDADGVLFDSERQSFEALRLTVESATDDKARLDTNRLDLYCGRDDESVVRDLNTAHGLSLDASRFSEDKLECFRKIIATDPVVPGAGVFDLLDRLDTAGIPYAVATSAARTKLQLSLRAVGLEDRFSTITSADDVSIGKPDPEIFLATAKRLAIEPGRLVVFEDAVNGVTAANRAGMFSVGIVGTFSGDQLSHARAVIDSLGEVSIDLLRRWVNGKTQITSGGERP